MAGVPASDDGDGSSPLVPILIGIALLAAVSAAAMMLRARRQGGEGGQPGTPSRAS